VAGAARPTDPMLGATIAHQRAPGRVDYARTPGGRRRQRRASRNR
jgi:hypothetical protein